MANLNDRVCIIGGGPAGISAAMYLQKKGYTNYEVYEKLNKVGGKSYSPKIEVNGEERTYETGAIMGAIRSISPNSLMPASKTTASQSSGTRLSIMGTPYWLLKFFSVRNV